MSIFDDLTKKVTTTAKAVTKKSGDILEVTKLYMNISSEEDKIQKGYAEIGKAVYEAYKSGESAGQEAVIEICERIKSYEENIKDTKQKIMELRKIKSCPGCESELEIDTAFCPKCGTKQEMPEPKEEPQVEEVKNKVCASCAGENSIDSAYCAKCGAKFE